MTVAVVGPKIMSLGLEVSTEIVNVSLSSTNVSSGTVMLKHTAVLTAVVEGIIRTSFVSRLKSLAPA